jgi:general secretion pathway protein A
VYTEFYGLDEKPFALLPDPRFLYLGSSHREALAHLLYGIEEGEGFIEVIGQVGTGKTTLCRTLLDRVGHDVDVAFIFNPSRTELELLTAINREFGLPTTGKDRGELMEELNEFLIKGKAAGRRMLLVIDEAQNLAPELLEQVRLLSNMETEREKLLQIVLIGQPELEENLSKTELRQLRQRITVRWNLKPFDRAECEEYIQHRLRVAGRRTGRPLFTPRAMRLLYRESAGIPRLVNALGDRALLAGYAASKERIDTKCVQAAARELSARPRARGGFWKTAAFGAGCIVATLSAVVLGMHYGVIPADIPARSAPTAEVDSAPAASVSSTVSGMAAPLSATAEGPELPSLGPLLMKRGARGTAADALAQLLYLWGYSKPIPSEIDPNAMASVLREVSPLKLLVRRSPLDQIAKLNLPVILELEPEDNQFRYVTLQRLDSDGTAVISAGDRIFVLNGEGLYRFWGGRAFFLWMNYQGMPAVQPGETSTAVRWVQDRLTQLGYLRPGDPSGEFDEITEDALRALQMKFNLEPTGLVNGETLIALYEALGYGGPKLLESGNGAGNGGGPS